MIRIPLLLPSLFLLLSSTPCFGQGGGQRCVFRIGLLSYSRNIDSAWLSPAHLQGVTLEKKANSGAPSSRRAEGELKLSRANMSTSWLHANVINNQLVFYESLPIQGAELPPIVAQAKFGGSVPKLAYLLMVPTPDEDVPYRVLVVDAGTSALPPASHLVVNLTKASVRGFLGERGFKALPGTRHLIPSIKNTNPRGYFRVYLDHGSDESKWKRIALTQWKADPSAQRICMVYQDGPRVAIRTFNQFVKGIEGPDMPDDTREPIKGPDQPNDQ